MINEFGLYKNTVPRWRIPGLNSDCSLDDQTQGWWLPFFDKEGNIHLVDTYHISTQGHNFLEKFINDNEKREDNSWLIGRSNFDYYYGGSVKITKDKEQYFEMVCDLRDFKIAKIDANDYREDDTVCGVQLYREHGYPNGVTLLRTSAKKDCTREAVNFMYKALDSVRSSWIFDYHIETLERFANDANVDAAVRKELMITIEYLQEIIRLESLKKEAAEKHRQKIKELKGRDD